MVKPSNIFFNRIKGEIKLGDYGEALILHDSMSSTFSGTLCYWAPERFSLDYKHDDSAYNIGCNIWSLGITLIEIILGEFPYKDRKGRITENIVLLQKQIGELQTKNLENHLGQMSIADSVKEFIRTCLVTSIKERTYDMIAGTEFYKSIKKPYNEVVKKYAEQYESDKKALEKEKELEQDLSKLKVEPKTSDTDPKKVFEQESFSFNVANVKEVKKIYIQRRSEILEGLYELDDRRLAIKRLFFRSHENPQKKKDRFIYEIQVIKKLNNKSPFLTYIYEYEIKETHGNLYMELMNMNLKELYLAVHKSVEKFPEQLLQCITVSTVNALSYCHAKNIIHCDVKPTNVLINQHGKIKLTDFDSAIDLDNSDKYDRIGGTMAYWAPDLFAIDKEGLRFDPRRDIWSLGITLAEALLGRLPYLDNDDPVPQGYETIKYLNKIIGDNNFLGVEFTLESFRDESIFYGKFARLEYNKTIIQFLSVCLHIIEEIPSLTELQTTDFYQACPKNSDEIYEIARNHIQTHFQETTQFFRPLVNSTVQPAPSSSTQIAAPLSAATKDENKNADLPTHIRCEKLLFSTRKALAKFSDFRKLLENEEKLDYYAKKACEFYTEKLLDEIKVYHHFSKPKGLVIIINEIDWAPNPKKRRNGSEQDAAKLETLFRDLGYEIYQQKTLENLTKKKMLDHLKAFATDVRHKDGKSCIVVIMAHGNEDVVCDIKGNRILINHEIKPLFNGENAEGNHDDGVNFDDQAEIQKLKNSLSTKQHIDGACFGKPKKPDPSQKNPFPDNPRRIPIYSDFFVLYATVRTTPAFRSSIDGSKFISVICYTFYKFAHLYDLEYMARYVGIV
uniref:mitogen-activated protein kinase kinase n=1 Tax=Acrobeloides nanus TaxID=290746 RepID=A0A914E3H2_9BILA